MSAAVLLSALALSYATSMPTPLTKAPGAYADDGEICGSERIECFRCGRALCAHKRGGRRGVPDS